MRSEIEKLERQRERLVGLIGNPGSPAITDAPGRQWGPSQARPAIPPSGGTLRAELEDVRGKLAAVSADTSHEEVRDLLQRESTLQLRIERGEAELRRLENEIHQAQRIAEDAAIREATGQREWQRRRDVVLAQIADIDDHLSGRKLIKPAGHLRGSDIQDDIRRKRVELERLRERVMQEAGLTEADIPQAAVASPS